MRIVVDTNRYRDFCASVPAAAERFQAAEQICLPFVTIAELQAGFLAGTEDERNARVLSIFLNRARVSTLLPDEDTTHHYALTWRAAPAGGLLSRRTICGSRRSHSSAASCFIVGTATTTTFYRAFE